MSLPGFNLFDKLKNIGSGIKNGWTNYWKWVDDNKKKIELSNNTDVRRDVVSDDTMHSFCNELMQSTPKIRKEYERIVSEDQKWFEKNPNAFIPNLYPTMGSGHLYVEFLIMNENGVSDKKGFNRNKDKFLKATKNIIMPIARKHGFTTADVYSVPTSIMNNDGTFSEKGDCINLVIFYEIA